MQWNYDEVIFPGGRGKWSWNKENSEKYGISNIKRNIVLKYNSIGLLHEYWWILSREVYHIARVFECNMIHCEGQYSCNNPFII